MKTLKKYRIIGRQIRRAVDDCAVFVKATRMAVRP